MGPEDEATDVHAQPVRRDAPIDLILRLSLNASASLCPTKSVRQEFLRLSLVRRAAFGECESRARIPTSALPLLSRSTGAGSIGGLMPHIPLPEGLPGI